jgi:hypothetical protein
MITRADAVHDALERLTEYGYVDGAGFACHGPMGAEALSSLGYDDLVGDWVEVYKARHRPIEAPPATGRIDSADRRSWQSALGDFSRVTDWNILFSRELQERPWPHVLHTWLPRLLAGYGGGLTHGLLRVAHAVRAMPRDHLPSDLALAELAAGLASWAGWYKPLPGRPELTGPLTIDQAIDGLPHPTERWTPIEAGTFTRLEELDGFAASVEAVGAPESADGALSDLTATFCRVLLANPDVFSQGLVHTVTPVAAVRTLLPYLPDVSVNTVYAQLWHVGAAIVCGFTARADGSRRSTAADPATVPTAGQISARAAEHRDPHAVKFSEACLREHTVRDDPVYLRAAQHVLDRTPAW